MRKLADYVEHTGITVEIESGPDWTTDEDGWEHHAYELLLKNPAEKTEMKLPWKHGTGITEDPDERPENILDVLISDGWGYEQAQSFEDWAGEYGYDTDSRKAERIWQAVKQQTNDFIDFLGGKRELEKLALRYDRL